MADRHKEREPACGGASTGRPDTTPGGVLTPPVVRTCVACRRRAPKDELVRIVRVADGGAAVDRTGAAPGRGAYVCSNVGCFEQALRRGRLGRALRTALDDEVAKTLIEEFTARKQAEKR